MDTEAFFQQLTAFYNRLRTLSQPPEQRATALELPFDKRMENLCSWSPRAPYRSCSG